LGYLIPRSDLLHGTALVDDRSFLNHLLAVTPWPLFGELGAMMISASVNL
jgi:hypothetical protein